MRIAVLGAGGVGGYYGGLLAKGGHDVALIARGPHLEALRRSGLLVESVHGDFRIRPARATDTPGEVGAVDLVLVTVKAYDLDRAASMAGPLLGPDTCVLPLLNGLDAAERLAAVLGDKPVLAGLTHTSAMVAAPGVVRQISAVRRITFGERGRPPSPRAERVREALEGGEIEVRLTADVQTALWEKFLFIASIGGICCLARRPMGDVLATVETRELYVEAMREIEALGRARSVALPPDITDRTLQLTAGFAPDTKPSLLVSLEAGQRLELDALSGTVVRLGRESGVPTPVHRMIYRALKPNTG